MSILELPTPELAPASNLRDLCMQVMRAADPTMLGYSYEELKAIDDISVSIMPEKKGMVFKHVEYLVDSRVSTYFSVIMCLVIFPNYNYIGVQVLSIEAI